MTACIVGWSHGKFGKLDAETSESLFVKAAAGANGFGRPSGTLVLLLLPLLDTDTHPSASCAWCL